MCVQSFWWRSSYNYDITLLTESSSQPEQSRLLRVRTGVARFRTHVPPIPLASENPQPTTQPKPNPEQTAPYEFPEELRALRTGESAPPVTDSNYIKPYVRKTQHRPHRVINYEGKEFGVWNHPGGRPRAVRLLYSKNFIPDEEYRSKHVIETRIVDKDGVRFMVYMQNGRILGAEFSPKLTVQNGSELSPPGVTQIYQPRPSNPTRTFVYKGRDVGVWEYRGNIRAIGLTSTNIIPTDEDRERYTIQTYMEHQHGLFFLVHQLLPSGNILGLELAPRWNS